MRYCKNCGLLQAPDAVQCPQCGAVLLPEPPAPSPAAPHYEGAHPVEQPDEGLSFGATLGALLLFAIPVAGFILSLVWSFGATRNPARRTLAQAYLVRTLIVAVLFAMLTLVFAITAYLMVTPVRFYY